MWRQKENIKLGQEKKLGRERKQKIGSDVKPQRETDISTKERK